MIDEEHLSFNMPDVRYVIVCKENTPTVGITRRSMIDEEHLSFNMPDVRYVIVCRENTPTVGITLYD